MQADTYGLCGVVHCLLHGKYMEVEKTRGVGEGAPTYRPKAQFKRWFCSHGMPTRVVKRLACVRNGHSKKSLKGIEGKRVDPD